MSDENQLETQNGSDDTASIPPSPIEVPPNPDAAFSMPRRTSHHRGAVAVSSKTTVRLLNADSFEGKLIVLEVETGAIYLVPSYEIAYRMKPQEIEKSVLADAERPYDWSQESERLGVDPEKARLALAMDGLIHKDDADEALLKRRLTVRGVIRQEG